MGIKTLSQSQLGQNTAKNSQIVTNAVKLTNSGTSTSPSISSIIVTDSGYNNLDDAAVSTSNSYIRVLGSNFTSTANLFLNGTMVPKANINFISSTELRVTLPVSNTGNYTLSLFNSNSSGCLYSNNFVVSTMPQWLTTSPLANVTTNSSFSTTFSATSDSPITYTNTTSLPANTTLLSNGYFYGTIGTNGTYTFDIKATDQELQDTTKTFSLGSSSQVIVQYLIVGGGGGGGGNWGGGGGAGGYLTGLSTVNPGSYTIVVGPGGAGANTTFSTSQNGASGIVSSFNSIIALGGGGGATSISAGNNENGFAGGSGGGGAGVTGPSTGGSGTSGQGQNGGSVPNVGGTGRYAGGGGGGGAGAVGGNSAANTSGNGGIGNTSTITGSSVTYAGGGGGGGYIGLGVTYGTGGAGGGGNGNSTSAMAGSNGTPNTGGGGGGGAGAAGRGGNGGSGVVVLSFPTSAYKGITTGSPTVFTLGSNTVAYFTANGSITF